jgi:tetratricopeptide (TPR) repeat protein
VFGRGLGESPWLLSAVTQAGSFFRYLALWLWPDSAAMSIDLRVDFFATSTAGWILLKVCAFAAFGALGLLMLRRRGSIGVGGLGLLWFWILFLIEFSTARFQEPFVLYRSYLWGPGAMLALAALLGALPVRATLAALAVAVPALFYQAHDRLVSFSNLLLLWEDAVAKLPARPVPWGSRTLYNLAREYAYAERMEDAKRIAQRCMAEYPDAFHCHTTYSMLHYQSKEYGAALPYAERAAELNPKAGVVHYRVGAVLQSLGRIEDAKARYRLASELGFKAADFVLEGLSAPQLPAAPGAARGGGAARTR